MDKILRSVCSDRGIGNKEEQTKLIGQFCDNPPPVMGYQDGPVFICTENTKNRFRRWLETHIGGYKKC